MPAPAVMGSSQPGIAMAHLIVGPLSLDVSRPYGGQARSFSFFRGNRIQFFRNRQLIMVDIEFKLRLLLSALNSTMFHVEHAQITHRHIECVWKFRTSEQDLRLATP